MNRKQKVTITICLIIIFCVFVIWFLNGAEIFTKTQVLIEKKDELFGTTYKEWKDKFVLGLDLTGVVTGVVLVTGSILLWIFRRKKTK
jgi:uncharacterized membrane protein YqiK